MKKYTLFSILLVGVLFSFSCDEKKNQKVGKISGAKLYKQNCIICHGLDGKMGVNGSKDLTLSKLTVKERVAIITKGKGAMAPYEEVLTKDEILAVAKFTTTLK